ncbi:MAG: hypothetical protein ACMUJM_06730 [bacterium]
MQNKWLYWTPRVLSIIFAIFISIFALDVFGAGYSFLDTIVALIIHLIPTYLVTIVAIIAWKGEITGGCLFIGLGLFYVIMEWNRTPLIASLLIPAPLFLIGGMFIMHWMLYRKAKPKL